MSSDPVDLVFYTASWCGPCRQMRPIVGEVYADVERHLSTLKRDDLVLGDFVVVDIDDEPELASASDITNIPTVSLRRNGETLASFVGARPKIDLRREILATLEN